MIDTIRFRIKLDKDQFNSIIKKSVETSKIDNSSQTLKFRVYNTNIELGSFDRNINIFCSDSNPDFAFLELSIPKFYYGQNVSLFYCNDLESVLRNIKDDLERYFGIFPDIQYWEIMRIDICYAWKFLSQDIAERVLELIRSYKMTKKKIYNYDSSIFQKGSTYSIKWYLKKPEFYYHDFPYLLKKYKESYAYEIANFSEGVLRFEVTMRHIHLQRVLGKQQILYTDITDDLCFALLEKYFIKFFKGKIPKFMNNQTVLNKLIIRYPPQKVLKDGRVKYSRVALIAYEYYLTINAMDALEKKKYLELKSKKTIYRLDNQLRQAGVGLPNEKNLHLSEFDFSIPSPYAVNQANVGIADMAGTAELF
jgi:II/X family phage/plasmid replication protein